jgi:hypothetical protein
MLTFVYTFIDISSDNNDEEEQASAVPHVVRRGMKQGMIGSPWSDEHKVLAVAIALKEPLREWPHMHQLNTFQGLVPYSNTTKQADLSSYLPPADQKWTRQRQCGAQIRLPSMWTGEIEDPHVYCTCSLHETAL